MFDDKLNFALVWGPSQSLVKHLVVSQVALSRFVHEIAWSRVLSFW